MKLRELLGFSPLNAWIPRSDWERDLFHCGVPVDNEVSTVDGQHYIDGKSIDVILEPALIKACSYNPDLNFIIHCILHSLDNSKLNLKPSCRGAVWAAVLEKMYSNACPDPHTPRPPYYDIFNALVKNLASLQKIHQLPEMASTIAKISQNALEKKHFDLINYMLSEFGDYSYARNNGPANGYDNRDLWDAVFKAVVMGTEDLLQPGSRSKEVHKLIVALGKRMRHSNLDLKATGLARVDLYKFFELIKQAAEKVFPSSYDTTHSTLMECYNRYSTVIECYNREHSRLQQEQKDEVEALAISNQAQQPVVDHPSALPQVAAPVEQRPVVVHTPTILSPKEVEEQLQAAREVAEELAAVFAAQRASASAPEVSSVAPAIVTPSKEPVVPSIEPPSYNEVEARAARILALREELAILTAEPASNEAEVAPPAYVAAVTPLLDHSKLCVVGNEEPTPDALAPSASLA